MHSTTISRSSLAIVIVLAGYAFATTEAHRRRGAPASELLQREVARSLGRNHTKKRRSPSQALIRFLRELEHEHRLDMPEQTAHPRRKVNISHAKQVFRGTGRSKSSRAHTVGLVQTKRFSGWSQMGCPGGCF